MLRYEYKKEYEYIKDEYDVIVVGGGTAGSTAAIAAAMQGAKTLIVEKDSFLGGSATGGQVTPMMHAGLEGNADSSFINGILKKRMKAENTGAADPCLNDGWFNPEMLKFTLEEMYLENGGHILYETEFIDSIVNDNKIEGIVVHNKAGMKAIGGKVVIDCTGDADVAYSAGVPCMQGYGETHRNQAVSLRFTVGNIDIKKHREFLDKLGEPTVLEYPFIEIAAVYGRKNPLSCYFTKAIEEGKIQVEDCRYIQAFSVPGMHGVMSFNCPEVQEIHNCLDDEARTKALIAGRKSIRRLFDFCKNYLPGFENSYILSVASMLGVRESRRIKGTYILSEEDYNNRARFNDAIARTAYPIDIHGVVDEKKLDVKPMQKGEFFEVPFRSLVPLEVDNLLVGGRCISSTFIAQSSIRIQPICRATGEAAGIAAAYCSKNNINVWDFDGKIAAAIMRKNGSAI